MNCAKKEQPLQHSQRSQSHEKCDKNEKKNHSIDFRRLRDTCSISIYPYLRFYNQNPKQIARKNIAWNIYFLFIYFTSSGLLI